MSFYPDALNDIKWAVPNDFDLKEKHLNKEQLISLSLTSTVQMTQGYCRNVTEPLKGLSWKAMPFVILRWGLPSKWKQAMLHTKFAKDKLLNYAIYGF